MQNPMKLNFCENYLLRSLSMIIFFSLAFRCYSQVNNAEQIKAENDYPIIEDFYPLEAFLDSSYDVVKLLSAGKEIPVLSTSDACKIFKEKSALFIDARGPDEFATGHIPGALNVPHDSVSVPKYAKTLSLIANDARIVVYCNTHLCIVSKTGAEGIIFNGFPRVIIAEGFWGWEERELPIEKE